jgi:hypothetical protein
VSKQTDKQRIVALQKALRIARALIEKMHDGGYGGTTTYTYVEDALDQIDKLDRNSKPDLVQDRPRS